MGPTFISMTPGGGGSRTAGPVPVAAAYRGSEEAPHGPPLFVVSVCRIGNSCHVGFVGVG